MIRLSRKSFAEISRLTSAGKRVKGLIHNLNGPLQNLGMDMDMIRYSIKESEDPFPSLLQEIENRLQRMDDEFERINHLIRSTAAVVSTTDEGYLSLEDFLDQELSFLDTNLYFKHNVEREVFFEGDLPPLGALSGGVSSGLRSLLEAVTEEIERLEMTTFSLKASMRGEVVDMRLTAGRGPMSEAFLKTADSASAADDAPIVDHEQMAAIHAFMRLKEAGVTYELKAGSYGTEIALSLEKQA